MNLFGMSNAVPDFIEEVPSDPIPRDTPRVAIPELPEPEFRFETQHRERLTGKIEEMERKVPTGKQHAIGQKVSALAHYMNALRRGLIPDTTTEEVQALLQGGGFAKGFIDSYQRRLPKVTGSQDLG